MPTISAWKVAQAAVQGAGHSYDGVPCQDAVATARRGETVAVCVCDGAGSARRSDQGAIAVAEAVAHYICLHADALTQGHQGADSVLEEARLTLREQANQTGGLVTDYTCTLLALVIRHDSALALQVGDGVIIAVEAGAARAIFQPDNGEYANETTFVTSVDALSRLQATLLPLSLTTTAFGLMTDGAQSALYDKQTRRVSPVILQVASWLQEDPEEVVSIDLARNIQEYLVPVTPDDCTIAILSLAPCDNRPPASPSATR